MDNAVFIKTRENVRKQMDIKLKTKEKRTKLSYNKFFSENLLAIEMRRIQILMNKPVLHKTKIWRKRTV